MKKREIDEIWKIIRETEKERREAEKERREWERERKEQEKEREKWKREMEELHKKSEKSMEELKKQVNRVTDGWGRWVEGSVAPSAASTFCKLGYKVTDRQFRRTMVENGRVIGEIDTFLLASKGKDKILFLGEAKSFCTSEDVRELKETVKKARVHLKEYKNYKIIGFIGGMNFSRGADRFALREGFYVFKPSGEIMVVDVPKDFKPKIF